MLENERVSEKSAVNVSSLIPVFLCDNVTCNGTKEYIIRASPNRSIIDNRKEYVFTADRENLSKRKIMAADSVVSNEKARFPVRVYVPDGERISLFKGTRVGWLEELNDVGELTEIVRLYDKSNELNEPNFLDQFKNTVDNEDLAKLLWEYRDIFSKTKLDLG